MSLQVKGKIEKVLDAQSGTSKAGKDWIKQSFVLKTEDEYNNLYCFESFGQESVDNFNKYHKVGDEVVVKFNVSTNEYQGKYYTSLSSWRVEKLAPVNTSSDVGVPVDELVDDDLPF